MTDEERKAKIAEQKRVYQLKNKEKIAEYDKAYQLKNKEKIAEQKRAWRLANKEKIKAYGQIDEYKKSNRMRNWRNIGVKDVNDELYNYYMNCDKCEVCSNGFKNSKDKHLDHNHDTGKFRYVLCGACNIQDNWKNKIDVKDN